MPPSPSLETLTDEELLVRLRAGDERAFESIAERYYPGLLRYLSAHVESVDVAEDLLQEIMIRVWHGRTTVSPWGGLRAYLYTAARHKILDDARGRRRAQHRDARLMRQWEFVSSDDREKFEREIDHEHMLTAIGAAADSLPSSAREIWRLYRDHGMSYAEIALVLGVSVSTVKTQMSRTLAKFRAVARPFLLLLPIFRL